MDVIDPGPIGGVSVGTHLDQVDLSNKFFINSLLGLDITFGLASLVTQLVNNTTGFNCITDRIVLIHGQAEALLCINMLSCLGSVNGHLSMPVVGRSNNDGIDIIGSQHLLVGPVTFGSWSHLFSCDFPAHIGSSGNGTFSKDIKEVADTCDTDIQVILLQEIRIPFVP